MPDTSVQVLVDSFDGVIDFDGPSGRKFPDLIGIDVAFSEIITTPADLALFTGAGLIDLPAAATGTAVGSGGGNLAVSYNTSAAANAQVTYIYRDTSIALIKYANGEDANDAPGVLLTVGDPVTWTYLITNTGEVDLAEITLVDDQEGTIECPNTTLAAGATMRCTKVSATGAVEGQYANVATVTAKTVDDGVNLQRTVTATDPSHYFANATAACPLNNDGLIELPELVYLGEGSNRIYADPVVFTLPAGYDTFIVKRRSAQGLPFSFDTDPGVLNTNGERTYAAEPQKGRNGQRVWACAGACNFVAHLDGEVNIGYLEPGITIGAVVIDDDTDDRINYWIGNANGQIENFPIEEQFMVEYLTFTIPYAADWSYFATDSVGIVDLCLSYSDHAFPVSSANNGVAFPLDSSLDEEESATEIFLPAVLWRRPLSLASTIVLLESLTHQTSLMV